MQASIISIGDELLVGQVVNTNASFIANELNKIGIIVKNILAVGDNERDILNSFEKYFLENDIVLVTGGLGPTHDDITKKAVCKFFNVKLYQSSEIKERIKRILSYRNIEWNAAAEEQTFVPENCTIIPNNLGTAAGFLFERNEKYFIVMPGVPYEMQDMMINFVIPFLSSKRKGDMIVHKTLRTTGITEAALSELIGNIETLLINNNQVSSTLAFLPSPAGVNLRITAKSLKNEYAKETLNEIERKIRAKAEYYIYGIESEDLESVVGKLLIERNLKIAVAESCTGGLIADKITNISGSSKYFERGIVAYSNQSKIEILGVKEELIVKYGAVSEEVAKAMAEGIRLISKTDIGISTTGIAGPTGGSVEKPVGLVWIGYSDAGETFALKNNFGNDRLLIKIRAAQAALNLVRLKLTGKKIK
ncbi:MAG: hypothetical protein IGBAC_0445 [Ignavibacteriae bacterium]|nr:MAG: hypothetical protein IGBAC_0445 [Ignavibacteriota bacterium]